MRVIARRPDAIVDFGETRIHAGTATFELRAGEVANPRPDDQLTIGAETFVVQSEPKPRDPARLVCSLDIRSACDSRRTEGSAPIERREESLQFGEADRLLRKLKAALISNFQACTNERAERGTSER